MRTGLVSIIIILSLVSCEDKKLIDLDYPITQVSLKDITVKDNFWTPIIERNRTITIPYAFEKCEETGRIDNFAKAAGIMEGDYIGERYNDSDVYKILEGACYSLINTPDPVLREYVDKLVELISGAQEEDGYLYTNRTVNPDKPAIGAGRDKWIDVWVSHELYSAGHMYEAAVAYYEANGSRTLLDVAFKNADLIDREFGWGKREAAPGHQEIEIGLVKLYRVSGEQRYLDLAKFFLDVRGKPQDHLDHEPGTRFAVYNDKPYLQQHLPVLEQREAVGHAVRAAYMYTGMSDVSAATGNIAYSEASSLIWDDVTSGKIYITGGIGSKEYGEAFGDKFELPNMTAYTETCASVANVFWNDRLFRQTGDAKYIDLLERTLYNGLISGVAIDGTNFFYPNPLESDGSFLRAGWFDCSCCPGNIARFLPQMAEYIYSTSGNDIFVNLFIGSEANLNTRGNTIGVSMDTDYPWSGDVDLQIRQTKSSEYTVKIRIPGWTGSQPVPGDLYRFTDAKSDRVYIEVNGEIIDYSIINGYAEIKRVWHKGDRVSIKLPLRVRYVSAREEVASDRGRQAITLGPMVYCIEEADNGKVREVVLNKGFTSETEFRRDMLGGIAVVKIFNKGDGADQTLSAIPYYAWNNRGKGEMEVWIKTR